MNAPRISLAFVLLLALSTGIAPTAPAPAEAGEDPAKRVAELEFELAVTRLRLDVWSQRTEHLYRFAGSLLEELEQARSAVSPKENALAEQVDVLRVSASS